jgi:hypothetical protein
MKVLLFHLLFVMCTYTCIHILGIRLGNEEDDNVACCLIREEDEDGDDVLKKNERKRVSFLLCVPACFINDLVLDEVEVGHVN